MKKRSIAHQLHQTSRILLKSLNDYLTPLGLYSAQWSVIYRLKLNSHCTQSELCEYLNVEAPTMTRTLTRLEKIGWVRRTNGSDRREKYIELTTQALEQYPKWEQVVRQFNEEITMILTDQEIEMLSNVTQRIIKKFESKREE